MSYTQDQNSKIRNQNHSSKPKNLLKEKSYTLSVRIISFLERLPRSFSVEIMSKQLLRSATSIGANIIEAKASSSRRDFINFLTHALKSANETEYWLCLLRDSKKAEEKSVEMLIEENGQICRMLGSSILTLKGKKESERS